MSVIGAEFAPEQGSPMDSRTVGEMAREDTQ